MPQLTGEIHSIKETQQVSDNFSKREFIVITDKGTNFPQYIKLEFTQANCSKLDAHKVGENVIVEYNLRGNLSKDSQTAYVSLQAWAIKI
jgi:archaellum component FlaG (FlaF/FlaG flagellin family)